MLDFELKNVNPKNKKTGDCSIRALANILDISWYDALTLLYNSAMKTGFEPADRRTMEKILNEFGYEKIAQPRKFDNTKYLIGELDRILSDEDMENGVVVNCANHYTVVRKGQVEDTWDCRRKSAGNYYAKRR